jgi:hypothetical protein
VAPGEYGTGPLAVDELGAPVVAASFTGSATVAGTSMTSAGGTDLVLQTFDSKGNPLSQWQWGGADDDYVGGLGVDTMGNAVMVGARRQLDITSIKSLFFVKMVR